MNEANQVRELIQDIAGTRERTSHFLYAEVLSMDGETITIKHGEIELTGVKLRAIANGNSSSIIINPTVGSIVQCADLSGGEMRDLTVIEYSEIDSIIINGGQLGGMVKVIDLTAKLNALENDINNLKKAFGSWIVIPSDGGSALKSITANWASSNIKKTEQSDIEDTKIKH